MESCVLGKIFELLDAFVFWSFCVLFHLTKTY